MAVQPDAPSVLNETTPLLTETTTPMPTNADGADEASCSDRGDDGFLSKEISTKKLTAIMTSLYVSVFFGALDNTVIATLAGPISSSFDSFSLIGWIASAYIIAGATIQPLSGKLTDIFGRRLGLLLSQASFAIGSIICGLANSSTTLILGRIISGIGGGGTMSITTFILSDLVPLRRRSMWSGFGTVIYGIGICLGGLFGGIINDRLNWRWAFIIQVPFIVLSTIPAAILVQIPVKEHEKSPLKRIDFGGSSLLTLFIVMFLLGIDLGGNHLGWKHPIVLVFLPVSVLLLVVFIWFEAKVAPEPVIPVHLLLNRTVFSACIVGWFGNMAATSISYFVPLFFQVQGASPTRAGLSLAPQAIGANISGVVVGWVVRQTGHYYGLLLAGGVIYMLGVASFQTMSSHQSLSIIYLYMTVTGIGLGFYLIIPLTALLAAVDQEHQATITGAVMAFRQTGSSIGITIAGTIFQNVLKKELWWRLGDRPGAGNVIDELRDNLGEIGKVPPSWREDVSMSYETAFHMVFYFVLGLASLATVGSIFIGRHKLHDNLARN